MHGARDFPAHYAQTIAAKGFAEDPAQLRAAASLARLRGELAADPAESLPGRLLQYLKPAALRAPRPSPRGVYLWGGVGRGKTFLMDLFFETLPAGQRLRYHFHRLMYRIHGRLKTLRSEADPLRVVAGELAAQARVLCFDEFFVADIADAMILGNLLRELMSRGVTLVATSNSAPEDLYKGGLQRERFLPAIRLLTDRMEVVHVGGETDYRLRVLEQAEIYHSPLDEHAERNLATWFRQIAPEAGGDREGLEVHDRRIPTRRRADGIAWFDFAALCAGPRSPDDYIEVARAFQTVILSGVPVLDETLEDQARRFIALVDELYDRRVKLIVSAAAPADSLYRGLRLCREFERTRSRLLEMQSIAYLAAPHVP
jgi:cell division protein ZapE